MDHQLIEDDNLIERYVTGQMSEFERIHFEEHFVDCVECLSAIEAAESFGSILSDLPPVDSQAAPAPPYAGEHRWRAVAIAAILVLSVAMPLLWMLWSRSQGLQQMLQPRGGISIHYLELVRGETPRGSEAPVFEVSPDQTGILLSADVPPIADRLWKVRLIAGDGATLWEQELVASPENSLNIFVPQAFLPAADYAVSLVPATADPGSAALTYPFRITHRPSRF